MTKNERSKLIGAFKLHFETLNYTVYENKMPYPAGMSLLEQIGKSENLSQMCMIKYFSPDEKASACLSWVEASIVTEDFTQFVQLNFGYSQFQTDNYDIALQVISMI